MRYHFILLFLFVSCAVSGQDRGQHNARVTIRGNIGIPKPLSSQMYRTSFTGVYEGNLALNLRLFGDFFAGLGYQNSHFQNNKKVFIYYTDPKSGYTLSYNTRHMGHGVFLKLGTDQFFSDKGYVSYSLNSGMMLSQFMNVAQDSAVENMPFVAQQFSAPFVQPEIAVNFISEKRLSFSFMLSYTTLLYQFDPKAPRFAHFAQVAKASNRYVMSWFNVGFGFNILLGK
jgi:hypothetical protein